MWRDAVWPRISRSACWLCALALLAMAAAVGVPLAASASSQTGGPAAASAAIQAVVYGGRTSQGWPVVIELRNRRLVAQALAGFDAPCTSGDSYSDWDRWTSLKVTRKGKFSAKFGPETQRFDDGTTADFQGAISGARNRAGSKFSGRWHFKATYYDTAGAVTDTCDTGNIRWTAKQ